MSKDIWTTQDTVSLPQHQPLDTLSVHDLARLRQIIGTVIDDGVDGNGDDNSSPWGTYDGFGGHTSQSEDGLPQREAFIERVITRIIATAGPSLREETTNEHGHRT